MQSGNGARSFLLDGGRLQELAPLAAGTTQSYAQQINAHADVVGESQTADGSLHAVLWRDGKVIDLGDFGGGASRSLARDINGSGFIVGYGTDAQTQKAALWTPDGTMWNLNDLIELGSGWSLANAMAINESGQIVGFGDNEMGWTHAFLLTPVPVPEAGTQALFIVAGAWAFAFGVLRKRRGAKG